MNTPGEIPGFQFYPHVGQVTIEGPFDAKGATDTASRRRIFTCQPRQGATAREEERCARTIVSTLAKRAFRRPTTAADMDALMEFYRAGAAKRARSTTASRPRCSASSPTPSSSIAGRRSRPAVAVGRTYRISDLALASRLSFFLWSSIPDDELIDVAAHGQAADPAVLEQQVRRMLKDPRADALIANFTGQWLGVRSLKTREPVVNVFPDFDDNLRNAFEKEIELFFASIVKRGPQHPRSADRQLHLRQRAAGQALRHPEHLRPAVPPRDASGRARHAPRPAGQGRVADRHVGGGAHVAGHAGQVVPADVPGRRAATAAAGRPGAEVPTPDTAGNEKTPTMRQMLEAHRIAVDCATCHKIFEPMGLALENFDAVGAWRTLDEGQPVDATGVLVDGTKVDGVESLRDALVSLSGSVRARRHREAPDLRPRPRRRASRTCRSCARS